MERDKLNSIRSKVDWSKFEPSLLIYVLHDLEDSEEAIDSGFVEIDIPQPLSKKRANYLKKLGVNAYKIGQDGKQIYTYHNTTLTDLIKLAKRPWVKRLTKSRKLHLL